MGHPESNVKVDPDWWSKSAMPNILIPEQYAGMLRPFTRSPETELLVAVIADAVAVYARHFLEPNAKQQLEFEEARSWFSSSSADGPFCFLNVCSALDLEPEAVRQRWQPSARTTSRCLRNVGARFAVGAAGVIPWGRRARDKQRGARPAQRQRAARRCRPPDRGCLAGAGAAFSRGPLIMGDGSIARQEAPAPHRHLSICLINPKFEPSYWGSTTPLPLYPGDKRCTMITGALPALAGLVPREHEVVLIDENVEPIDFEALRRFDIVGVTGMNVQKKRLLEILARLRDLEVIVAVGGAYATVDPACFAGRCDVLFRGEAETTWPVFLASVAAGELWQSEYTQAEPTDMTR
jgi:hypothetical protein